MGSIQFNQTTGYCTVADVARVFPREVDFGSDTNPSSNDVYEFILDKSEEIDRYTRHAWRENTVTDELHDFTGIYRWGSGRAVKLNKRAVRSFSTGDGDKIELWQGDSWNDWLTDSGKSEGRENDYWLDSTAGILYLYARWAWRSTPKLRITYRYGESQIPRNIAKACAKLVAIELAEGDQYTQLIPGGEGGVDTDTMVRNWRADVGGDYSNENRKGILDRYKTDPEWVEPF